MNFDNLMHYDLALSVYTASLDFAPLTMTVFTILRNSISQINIYSVITVSYKAHFKKERVKINIEKLTAVFNKNTRS